METTGQKPTEPRLINKYLIKFQVDYPTVFEGYILATDEEDAKSSVEETYGVGHDFKILEIRLANMEELGLDEATAN